MNTGTVYLDGHQRENKIEPNNASSSNTNNKDTKNVDDNNNKGASANTNTITTTTAADTIITTSSRPLLTPHTLRLLRLIEGGSTDHARMAVTHLKVVTMGSCPLVLWEILGRLQAYLVSPEWNTRSNAGLAMEGVAQHLPLQDQEEFLSQDHHYHHHRRYDGDNINNNNENDNNNDEDSTWLKIIDLEENFPTILKKGRLLFAAVESRYQGKEDDEQLEHLDESYQGSKHFCRMRLEMQRSILNKRLGLSNILAHYSIDVDQSIKSELIDEHPKKKQKRDCKTSKKKARVSIRALLTMEIRQQQQQQRQQHNDSSNTVSHRNAQSLLAGELMFRIFDPSWHVRHGSLIGILALIRAWKAHNNRQYGEDLFGVWPQDILACTLCVLALDRFGDYSGASMEETVSGGMVAPIREMAGQVFAVVFLMSPEPLRLKVIGLLNLLLQHDEWETRHGALLAIKYIVVLMAASSKTPAEKCQWKEHFLVYFVDTVISGLEDKNDDVQGVASQILCFSLPYFDTDKEEESNFIPRVIQSLWKSLVNIRVVSSSINDIVKLLSQIIRTNAMVALHVISNTDSSLHGLVQIFTQMSELLQCELKSVKISILYVIGSLSRQLVQLLSKQNQPTISEADKVQARECFCVIVKDVYSLCCETSLVHNDDEHNNQNGNSDLKVLHKTCDETWTILSEVSNIVFRDSIPMQNELDYNLLTNYFDARENMKLSDGFSLMVRTDHATTIAAIFVDNGKNQPDETGPDNCIERYNILALFLLSYVDSPFIFHCEALCFLVQALFKSNVQSSHSNDEKVDLITILQLCQTRLLAKLEKGILGKFYKRSDQIMQEPQSLKIITDSISTGYKMVFRREGSGKAAAATVIDLWREAGMFPKYVKDTPATQLTIDYMRLYSQIVGTLIAGGIIYLPKKLTPIVRPLMTSIQNEQDKKFQDLISSYMESFLLVIINGPVPSERFDGFQKTFLKVLNNLCSLLLEDNEPSCTAATVVIGSLVRNLRKEKTLQDLKPVWDRLCPLLESSINADTVGKTNALRMLKAVCRMLKRNNEITFKIFDDFMYSLIDIGCSDHPSLRIMSSSIIKDMCSVDASLVLEKALPILIVSLQDGKNDTQRSGACLLLRDILDSTERITTVCPFVRTLLPIVMSMMIDPVKICAEISASIFSHLVQVAPLVDKSVTFNESQTTHDASLVIDHLIHGKKLLPCEIHPTISKALCDGGIVLRNYQLEGVSWLRFLQSINLNGALCDSMGLGKTLQAILAVSLAHMDYADDEEQAKSLVICPASIVGHWVNEIKRYFPGNSVFHALSFVGNAQQRKVLLESKLETCNLIVTSYEILRSDIDALSKVNWTYCILDEGHLLRNPKTLTARASRRLRARHKLILTGTPIQNSVNEVWATFDFLMPNFLGSSSQFSKEFARPIIKGQNFDAAALDIATGMEKLKLLHQQVLPFILRREKEQVLKELPPKIITRIPCPMSTIQEDLYHRFCSDQQGKQSISSLDKIVNTTHPSDANKSSMLSPEVLKSLLYLRLLCTHPWLVRANKQGPKNQHMHDSRYILEASGKLVALRELLRDAGMNFNELTAADNDSSLLYCDKDEEEVSATDEYEKILDPNCDDSSDVMHSRQQNISDRNGSRCLIFGQFTNSLDIVEELLLKRHMPSVEYLRLDGRVPASKRSGIVDKFNRDDSIKILLLTTKIGGLGLNLTGADTVIFLEHDWNPHTDLQAMDRAHRIGQKRTVHVYQLVTMNSIEEKTMLIHERKLAMSKAIVNTDNSSMYSMGTDRLLDIFQFRSESSTNSNSDSDFNNTLDSLVERYQDEYQSLSLNDFLAGFECEPSSKSITPVPKNA